MPLYDYTCKSCDIDWEAFHHISERRMENCRECLRPAEIIFKKAPALSIFQPGFYEDIAERPIWIETPQELRSECDKHGVRARYLEEGVWKTSPGPDFEPEPR